MSRPEGQSGAQKAVRQIKVWLVARHHKGGFGEPEEGLTIAGSETSNARLDSLEACRETVDRERIETKPAASARLMSNLRDLGQLNYFYFRL